MAAGSTSKATFEEVRAKAREARLACVYDPAKPEADGEDEAEDGLAFDDERFDGEGDVEGEVAELGGERDDSMDDTE